MLCKDLLHSCVLCKDDMCCVRIYSTDCSFVVVVGYTIFRASNLQKNNFRTNPRDPSLARKY